MLASALAFLVMQVSPWTCGQTSIRRDIKDESFGSRLEISEAITDALASQERGDNERLQDFIQTFDDKLLQRYVTGEAFDLRRYVEEVHMTRLVRPNDDRVTPMLGALYLPSNKTLLLGRNGPSRDGTFERTSGV